MLGGIREVETSKDRDGNYDRVRIKFGPHHSVEVKRGASGSVTFDLRYTHHGFKADASNLDGELEQIINSVRDDFPGNSID